MTYRLYQEKYAVMIQLQAEYAAKRVAATNRLIELIEQIEPIFEPLSIKLNELFTQAFQITYGESFDADDELFIAFCQAQREDFELTLNLINSENKEKNYGRDTTVELFIDNTLRIENNGVDFKAELDNLRKYGTLTLPYASSELLEFDTEATFNNFLKVLNGFNELEHWLYGVDINIETLKLLISELEEDTKNTIKYFNVYIEPTKEIYKEYLYFMEHYTDLFLGFSSANNRKR